MISKIRKKISKKTTATKKTVKKTSTTKRKSTKKTVNPEELFQLVERKAYELFEKRGYTHGNDQNDWFEAEKEILSSLKK